MGTPPHDLNVLLVDDDEDAYVLTEGLLAAQTRSRVKLDWAQTYDEGRDRMRSRLHDLYLVDYRLGAHNGLELIREVFGGKDVAPAIILTGHAAGDLDLEAAGAGVVDFIEKGRLEPDELERAIRYGVRHYEVHEQLQASQEQLAHDAMHDALTGMPNRVLFMDRLAHALRRQTRSGERIAVLFCDVDRFKLVNDSFDHSTGDELLVTLTRRLSRLLRPSDTIARMGGDEFAILLEDVTGLDDAIIVSDRIEQALAVSFRVGNRDLRISASVGIALSEHGSEPAELVRNADIAMYDAKRQSEKRTAVFDAGMHGRVVEQLEIEHELREALDAGTIWVAYQPIINIADGRLIALEALARWPEGLPPVGPDQFIPVAEEAGLIEAVGRHVMRESCRQVAEWRRNNVIEADVGLSVNVSGRQFADPGFVGVVLDTLAETGIPPEVLALEITESTVIDAPSLLAGTLGRLLDAGVKPQLDDFGTGYSSLTFLHDFPGEVIKVDRSFIDRIAEDPGRREIVTAIVSLAHNLGLKVIAEGVEDDGQLEILRGLGCAYAQGYLFARPLPAAEVPAVVGTLERVLGQGVAFTSG